MAEATTTPAPNRPLLSNDIMRRRSPYDEWIESLGIPIHRGYYIEDARTIPVAPWRERECNACILQLAGQEGVTEARVTEIPPGQTLPPFRFALDEIVYVVEGRGTTTVWSDASQKKTFEWQKHSLFLLPRNFSHQLTNMQGSAPARLLHYNYLPSALAITPDPDFFFKNPFQSDGLLSGPGGSNDGEFYSEAKVVLPTDEDENSGRAYWTGNFFPDMRAWDRLVPFRGRGAGGHVVWIQYPSATITNHMSVFPAQTYKKAHRHGPGVVIIIPAGEGFSVMWPEGQDKVFIPWHEASVFVPPNRWFHQHFNVGSAPGRYLAFHAPRFSNMNSERVEDRVRDQIEYPDEDPWIRQTFEAELAKRGLTSLMPRQAYTDPNYEWSYSQEQTHD
jgi:mannose-6-phosphate isomerase-like protein (cupin superfamily)